MTWCLPASRTSLLLNSNNLDCPGTPSPLSFKIITVHESPIDIFFLTVRFHLYGIILLYLPLVV